MIDVDGEDAFDEAAPLFGVRAVAGLATENAAAHGALGGVVGRFPIGQIVIGAMRFLSFDTSHPATYQVEVELEVNYAELVPSHPQQGRAYWVSTPASTTGS